MRNTFKAAALGIVASLGISTASLASDFDALLQTCAACHGEKGDKPIMAQYPIIAGQHASYLEHSMKAYRSGERRNAVMNAQAANLTDREIRALARYYSRQESPLYTPAYSR
jgi:cytochrome c553